MRKRGNSVTSDGAILVSELQKLGFTDYEAKAYLSLLQLGGPATAYEISKIAGIPRANAYSVLENLVAKRAAQPVSKTPLRHVPTEPEILLNRIAEETEQQCRQIGEKLATLRSSRAVDDYVWYVTGELEVNAKIREIIDNAESHVWIKAYESALDPHFTALQKAAERGVQILIILFGTQVEKYQFKGNSRTYLHEGNGILVGTAHNLITITRDFSEALIANLRDNIHGAYTFSRPVVNMADTMIRHEIYFAEIFERFGPEIERAFGPALYDLRRRFLPREQSDHLENILTSEGLLASTETKELPRGQRSKKAQGK